MLADFHYHNEYDNRININRTMVQVEVIPDVNVIRIDVENDQYLIPIDTIISETHLNEDGKEEGPEVDVYVCADGSNYEVTYV